MGINEETLQNALEVLLPIIDSIPLCCCVINSENHVILHGNARFRTFFQVGAHTSADKCFSLLYGFNDVCDFCPASRYKKQGGQKWNVMERFHADSGTWITTHTVILEFPNCPPLCLAFFTPFRDMGSNGTREKYPEHFDALTGLVNHRGYTRLGATLFQEARERGSRLAVLAVKIDGLREINTLSGYMVGDEVLKKLAYAMLEVLPGTSLLARLRRNEFCALIPMDTPLTRNELQHVSQRISELSSSPILGKFGGICQLHVGGCLQEKEEAFADLNYLAWKACSRAIDDSLIRPNVIKKGENARHLMLREIRGELDDALAENVMRLFFQPKYDVHARRMIGAEALLRWQHKLHGHISPALFIPIAEKYGKITAVDTWVINETCRVLRTQLDADITPVTVSVNISACTFFDAQLEDILLEACERHGIPPHLLELELTEGTALRNIDLFRNIMIRLQQRGFSISMDDFGAGYASLSNLMLLPFNTIKIDRSFITHITSKSVKVLSAIMSLMHSYDLNVVMEGVETKEQFKLVCNAGCRIIQGYYISQPVPEAVFTDMLRNGAPQAPHNTL